MNIGVLKLLGDEGRLRILNLLDRERLNVSELVSILGVAQPGVSRHLRLLREAGLVEEDRKAGWSFYRARRAAFAGGTAGALLQDLRASRDYHDDVTRLREILRLRTDSAPAGRHLVPGRSWAAWARALGLLMPPLRVADLGCGEGYLALEIASWASRVVAVDASKDMLDHARKRAARRNVGNVTWKVGRIEKPPVATASVDLVLLSQVLHCSADPARVLSEARRILVKAGRVLVLDLQSHTEEWVRKDLGHVWMGFDRRELAKLMGSAGFKDVRVRHGDSRRGDPFAVLVADGRNP